MALTPCPMHQGPVSKTDDISGTELASIEIPKLVASGVEAS